MAESRPPYHRLLALCHHARRVASAILVTETLEEAYVLAEGKTVMEGSAAAIRGDADVKRRYLGEV